MRKPAPTRSLVVAALAIVCTATAALAQGVSAAPRPVQVTGTVNVNSKGISQVPALTLGRPAAIFDLALRKGDLSFEPQIRFALDGTPWSFLFWGRYRAVNHPRFRLAIGAHPAFSFKTITAEVNGTDRDRIEVRRYLAAEVTPTVVVSRHVHIGGHNLYSHGLDPGAAPHTNLAAVRLYLVNVPIGGKVVFQAAPQFYYLSTNGRDGTYVSATASLGWRGTPWSVTSIVNQPIRTRVVGGQRALWNVGLSYAFR